MESRFLSADQIEKEPIKVNGFTVDFVTFKILGGSVAEWLGHGFKSRSDHLAVNVSWWTLVQLLGHACI